MCFTAISDGFQAAIWLWTLCGALWILRTRINPAVDVFKDAIIPIL